MTQVRFKVKSGDTVEVIAGKDKGKRGMVTKVFLKEAKILVDGVNQKIKNVRMSEANPEGGRYAKYHPIHISNVAIVNPATDKCEKVGIRVNQDGKKERYFKKTGNTFTRE